MIKSYLTSVDHRFYVLICLIGIAVIISLLGTKKTKVFHYNVDKDTLIIKWNIGNQIVSILIGFLIGLGLFEMVFFDEQMTKYRTLIILIAMGCSVVGLLYIIERLKKLNYITIDKRQGTLYHEKSTIDLKEITGINLTASQDSEGDKKVYMYLQLQSGKAFQIDTFVTASLITERVMYRDLAEQISNFIGVKVNDEI